MSICIQILKLLYSKYPLISPEVQWTIDGPSAWAASSASELYLAHMCLMRSIRFKYICSNFFHRISKLIDPMMIKDYPQPYDV